MDKKYCKYILTNDTINYNGVTLYRIKATCSFSGFGGNVEKGDLGVYIQSRRSLSAFDDCWVYDDALVFDNALVIGKATIKGRSHIYGDAVVTDSAKVYDSVVSGHARVSNNAVINGVA